MGCGPQEEFRACSDIAIGHSPVLGGGNGQAATTPRNPAMTTSLRPWWASTTKRPWWSSTTKRPWWESTTRRPWWMSTTRRPWWATTSRRPWWKPTTAKPWWASTSRTPATTKRPWWSSSGSWSWNSWTRTGNGRGPVDENKVWLRSSFPGLAVEEGEKSINEIKTYEELATSWAEHLLRGIFFFFNEYIPNLFSQSKL